MLFDDLLDALDKYVEVKRAGMPDERYEGAKGELMLALDNYIDERVRVGLSKYELEDGVEKLHENLRPAGPQSDL